MMTHAYMDTSDDSKEPKTSSIINFPSSSFMLHFLKIHYIFYATIYEKVQHEIKMITGKTTKIGQIV